MRKFYRHHQILKYPKPWNSDRAQGQEDSLLTQFKMIKPIEELQKHRFQQWLTTEQKLPPEQFAYQPQHSAATQLHSLAHNILTNKLQKKTIALI
jgi:hypothetical protein